MGKWLIDLGVQYLSINVDATDLHAGLRADSEGAEVGSIAAFSGMSPVSRASSHPASIFLRERHGEPVNRVPCCWITDRYGILDLEI